jgi:low affinity Fe/Cu permease
MFIAYFNRQIGAILIGILLPFYLRLIDFSSAKVLFFIFSVTSIQVGVTHVVQNCLIDKYNLTINQSLFSQNEKRAIIL